VRAHARLKLRNVTGDVKMIDRILGAAVKHGASDIHLNSGLPPMMRVNGEIKAMPGFPPLEPQNIKGLVFPLLSAKEKRELDEERDADFSYWADGLGRFRSHVFFEHGKPAANFRVIAQKIPSLATLNAPLALLNFARLERGLVLVTGPTGSGKTTTLAAMLDIINTERACHIVTLEHPIEFVHQRKRALISQREIGDDALSFARGLRAAMREDPDVILVGEMRDPETTQVALSAAETGHLVFSTLHTRSATSTVERIIDQFPAGQQDQIKTMLASSLQGVVCQSLVPRADEPGKRIAVHEIMAMTMAIQNMIRTGKTEQLRGALQIGVEQGMQTMDMALAYYTHQGVISYEMGRQRAQDLGSYEDLMRAYRENRPVMTPRFVRPQDIPVYIAREPSAPQSPHARPAHAPPRVVPPTNPPAATELLADSQETTVSPAPPPPSRPPTPAATGPPKPFDTPLTPVLRSASSRRPLPSELRRRKALLQRAPGGAPPTPPASSPFDDASPPRFQKR
jgi:twitching motility protein PilT